MVSVGEYFSIGQVSNFARQCRASATSSLWAMGALPARGVLCQASHWSHGAR